MALQRVSCIIPTYNRAEKCVRAIRSILDQDYPEREVIVIDDGSTDGTEEAVRGQFGKGIRYERQERRGVSAARNRGIELAQGEWIALLDSDDEWLPQKLTRQVEFFQQHPDFLVCQTDEIWIRRGRRVNPMKKHRKYGGWIFDKCLPLCIVTPSAVMMHRRLLEQVGDFDETLPACEDYDLWLRIAARYPLELIPEKLVVKYGGHPDQLSFTEKHLDRYRIRALEKILDSGTLTPEQHRQALGELRKKCSIYGQGCLKRGKEDEGSRILTLPTKFEESSR